MPGLSFGKILSALRKERGFSQRELAQLLQTQGFVLSNQALSKWETDLTLPNAKQFLALCSALGVDRPLAAFGGQEQTPRLNEVGQRKVREYEADLVASGRYQPGQPSEPVIRRTLPLYHISASAGTGQFLDSSSYELIEVGSDVPAAANFAVRIAGDSMEPRFADGQIVWVRQQQTLEEGEIGIFLLGGNSYCKKLHLEQGKPCLLSLNTAYPPIRPSPEAELRVMGKVVGA